MVPIFFASRSHLLHCLPVSGPDWCVNLLLSRRRLHSFSRGKLWVSSMLLGFNLFVCFFVYLQQHNRIMIEIVCFSTALLGIWKISVFPSGASYRYIWPVWSPDVGVDAMWSTFSSIHTHVRTYTRTQTSSQAEQLPAVGRLPQFVFGIVQQICAAPQQK